MKYPPGSKVHSFIDLKKEPFFPERIQLLLCSIRGILHMVKFFKKKTFPEILNSKFAYK